MHRGVWEKGGLSGSQAKSREAGHPSRADTGARV